MSSNSLRDLVGRNVASESRVLAVPGDAHSMGTFGCWGGV